MRRLILATLACCHLGAGCATRGADPGPSGALPELRLAPAQLGASISAAQRLTFHATRESRRRSVSGSVDIALQADATSLRIVALALGRRVFALQWDGASLTEERDARVPAELTAARILRDIQFAYWPALAVRAALPPGWQLDASDSLRELHDSGGAVLLRARFVGASPWQGQVNIENFAERYELIIESSVLRD